MKVMVFDVGGTEIKYSVMDEQMNRFDAGSVPTPQDTQEHFLDTIYALYAPHKDEVDGIAMALPGFVDANTGYVSNGGALLYNTGTQVGQLVRERCGCRVTLETTARLQPLQSCGPVLAGLPQCGSVYHRHRRGRRHHCQWPAGARRALYRRRVQLCEHQRDEWENTEKTMACQCSTKYLLKWYRARKGLPADAPMNGKLFFDAANAAEPEALEVLERFCKMVAVQIYNLTVLLDVEKVAIGGGISKQPLLLDDLRRVYAGLFASRGESPYMIGLPRCEIVPCHFSSEANQVGALYTYLQAESKTI